VKLLLDTHVFIWLATEPSMLSPRAYALCQDAANDLVLSIASIWEMQIKYQLGKLTFEVPLEQILSTQRAVNEITILPIELAHVLALQTLPPLHKDPFDRMLIAQSTVEDLALLTADSTLSAYPVRVFSV
jgi:PIN domain nuclease of toxin-antitoxin system